MTLFGLILENSQLYENSEQESKRNQVSPILTYYTYLFTFQITIDFVRHSEVKILQPW